MRIRIEAPALQDMIEHADSQHPLECCGLLSGRGGVIQTATRATNESHSSHQFFVPAAELFAFFREVRRSDRQFLGIYHSHPFSEALPSRRDAAEFFYPEASYWILSGRQPEPEVRCFVWSGTAFQEKRFEVVEAERSPARRG